MTKLETDALLAMKDRCDRLPYAAALVDLKGRLHLDADGRCRVIHEGSSIEVRYAVLHLDRVQACRYQVVYCNDLYRRIETAGRGMSGGVLVGLGKSGDDVLLDTLEVRVLCELVTEYLADGGPAMECMPEWHPDFTPEVLARVREKVCRVFGEEKAKES